MSHYSHTGRFNFDWTSDLLEILEGSDIPDLNGVVLAGRHEEVALLWGKAYAGHIFVVSRKNGKTLEISVPESNCVVL